MANSAELLINIRAQNQQALRSLDRVNRAVNQMNRNTTRGLRGATREANNFNGVLAQTAKRIGAFFVIRQGAGLIVEMARLSSSAEEVQTRYDTVMKGMEEETNKMVESAVSNLGLLRQELQDTVSVTQNIAKSMGFSAQEAGVFSRAITSLSADMTSFFDLPFSEAFRALKSGLVGETEPLRRLGILTTENALANFAMAKGISKSIRKMSEKEKMVLRLVAITEQSKSSQGDLGKTLDSSANMFRVMVSRVKELGTTLGWFITESLAPLVKWIIVIVQAMNAFFQSIRNLKKKLKD